MTGAACRKAIAANGDGRKQPFPTVTCKSQLLHTSLNGMDLRSCELDGFRLAPQDLKGAIVTPEQAMMLAGFLGVVIR